MTTITFVRHGNTDWNIEKRAQGHSSNPLNDTGLSQARAVAERLAKGSWDFFFSSDLLRAKQTAEIISSHINQPIMFDERLRERDRGDIEGTTEEERIQRWGKDWRKLNLWQESYQSLRLRGSQFVEEIHAKYPAQDIIVVTHGKLLIETLYELCPEETDHNDLLNNASVTIIRKGAQRWHYDLYNCTSHLSNEVLTK